MSLPSPELCLLFLASLTYQHEFCYVFASIKPGLASPWTLNIEYHNSLDNAIPIISRYVVQLLGRLDRRPVCNHKINLNLFCGDSINSAQQAIGLPAYILNADFFSANRTSIEGNPSDRRDAHYEQNAAGFQKLHRLVQRLLVAATFDDGIQSQGFFFQDRLNDICLFRVARPHGSGFIRLRQARIDFIRRINPGNSSYLR